MATLIRLKQNNKLHNYINKVVVIINNRFRRMFNKKNKEENGKDTLIDVDSYGI